MATINKINPTLKDVAERFGKDGKAYKIVELLAQTNQIIEDATFIECNDGTNHKTVVRTGLPDVTWRKLNYGVQPSKSQTAQVKDACGMLEAYAEIDKDLADMSGNTPEFRLSEDQAFLESMNQNFAETLFYGDTEQEPEKFMGLSARYNDLSAKNGENILDGGGSGSDNTSIWLLVWGPTTMHCIYPKGSQAGLSHRDLGEETLTDSNGGKFQGYRTHYKMNPGFSLRDWRYAVRIANVDVSELTKDASAGADLVDLITQALEQVPNLEMGRAVIYCNKTIRSFLRRQIKNSNNVHLSMDEVAGKKVLSFDGVPVKKCDAILNTEAVVS